MSAVTKQEIVEALRGDWDDSARLWFADRLERHGIAPPDGWVLVPKEPTVEMIEAAIKNGYEGDERIYEYVTSDYKAMLAAAPEVTYAQEAVK